MLQATGYIPHEPTLLLPARRSTQHPAQSLHRLVRGRGTDREEVLGGRLETSSVDAFPLSATHLNPDLGCRQQSAAWLSPMIFFCGNHKNIVLLRMTACHTGGI